MKTNIKLLIAGAMFLAVAAPLCANQNAVKSAITNADEKALTLTLENARLKKEIESIKTKNAALEKQLSSSCATQQQPQQKKMTRLFDDVDNIVYDEDNIRDYVTGKNDASYLLDVMRGELPANISATSPLDAHKRFVPIARSEVHKFAEAFSKAQPGVVLTIKGYLLWDYDLEIAYYPSVLPKGIPAGYSLEEYTQVISKNTRTMEDKLISYIEPQLSYGGKAADGKFAFDYKFNIILK